MKKVLVIRFSSIGDIVLTTPVVRILKTQLDDAQVHFCTKKQFASLFDDNPYVDKVHVLGDKLDDLISSLKKENFDYIIDLHSNLRTRIIKLKLGKKAYTFDKLNLKKWLYVNFKLDVMPNKHIVDRYVDTLKPLGLKMDALGLDYFIPEQYAYNADWLPENFQRGFVAVVIGASYATKRLPTDKIIQLCDQISAPIVLIGGPSDKEEADKIESFFDNDSSPVNTENRLFELGKRSIIFNAVGKFNLHQSAALVKQAKFVFSHDTGFMHIAAAFKKECFTIWGNTTPELGMYPYRTKFTIFEVKNLKCRPCSKIGFDKCPKGHFKCMNDQKFDFYLPNIQ
ncbi:glycosyltransferase family 9 protein [Aureibacter tunicatorum]|uniref:ADP-heptose:LPS heptosyltransferase n=1 Tax=Aureibacter tunicatorum TaxID=866807 RepID=A0AAE3XQ37_9BACT|nr:glycosyltransferase family 9 protein [Aureibacter tunicatorum]MDR6240023.1 ADP-heptose:LPS heptosyltransferase [Aureibacter tunicatorum]BDD04495.1 glycosyl hydrolase [Aureibacter tunicatorum]